MAANSITSLLGLNGNHTEGGQRNGHANGATHDSEGGSLSSYSLLNNGDSATRPFVLVYAPTNTRVTFAVGADNEHWVAAEILKDAFVRFLVADQDAQIALANDTQSSSDDADDDEEEGAKTKSKLALKMQSEKEILLLALFMRFVSLPNQISSNKNARASLNIDVLLAAFNFFVRHHLDATSSDLHAVAAQFDTEQRRILIRAFYEARTALEQNQQSKFSSGPSSKLFGRSEGGPTMQALFGGQGHNEVYFDEMQNLYNLYAPLLQTFLAKSSALLTDLARKHSDTLLYQNGFNPLAWLQQPSTRPPVPYMASCAVSLPAIGLTQIATYVVIARVLSLSPSTMRGKFAGATGHSQGVVTACLVSRAADQTDTWDAFCEDSLKALKLLFYIGLRASEKFPQRSLAPSLVKDCVDNGEGMPTAMLSVVGLPQKALQKKIDDTNGHLVASSKGKVEISLYNGVKAFVVTGPPASLAGLVSQLRKGKAEPGKDQSKIPFSKRLPNFSIRFLPVGLPYHSSYLDGCTQTVLQNDVTKEDSQFWDRSHLSIPVYNTENGCDLRENSKNVTLEQELCDQIFTSHIHWSKATTYANTGKGSVSHAVDFGPGGNSGIGSLVAREQDGTGIRVIFASGGTSGRGNEEIFNASHVKYEQKWKDAYAPKLVKTANGKVQLDTPFSRLLSKAPLMVAGMTPCTVQTGFNAATMNAGYHIELAGGGHYNEKALRARVADISKQLKTPGLGLTLNSLYINQRQWTFQFPLWCQMRREGLPVEGFCVAAGIPSTEKAVEIITALRESGIKHVSFKPGSVEGIRQVINIAATNPDFPIIMQWTGGRAGGHHSCEDFHQPILSTYGSIRQYSNLVLVGGSGFGGADDVWPYLTGDWSVAYGYQPMPYDGFLFASRVMVAKEAHTSESVKQLIVDAPGVDDDKWEQTYEKPTGGILTVTSELGEPIHKVATRGVKLWREFDDTVFSLPKEKRAAWLKDKKEYVIKRLNADFQRPWFGMKDDGKTCDVFEMTYGETLRRMVRLMYVKHQSRWIDVTLRNLVGDWVRRTEERLADAPSEKQQRISELQSFSELDEPFAFLERFTKRYPQADTQILASTDERYFLALCQRPSQKPVPFIPVLDETFGVWFKKDSLWQAEDIEAVFDQDPQRVCILQGPVAVKHSKRTDEPIAELLGNIEAGLIQKTLERYYDGKEASVPQEAYLARRGDAQISREDVLERFGITHSSEDGPTVGSTTHIYDITKDLPTSAEWLDALSGPDASWLRAFLLSQSIVQGSRVVDNQAARVFAPRANQRIKLSINAAGQATKVEVFGAIRSA